MQLWSETSDVAVLWCRCSCTIVPPLEGFHCNGTPDAAGMVGDREDGRPAVHDSSA